MTSHPHKPKSNKELALDDCIGLITPEQIQTLQQFNEHQILQLRQALQFGIAGEDYAYLVGSPKANKASMMSFIRLHLQAGKTIGQIRLLAEIQTNNAISKRKAKKLNRVLA